jgi:hypothetical protein
MGVCPTNTGLRTSCADEKAPESLSFLGNETVMEMAKENEHKSRKVTVRFTPKEWEEVAVQMQNFDYLSMSKFIRDKVLNKRIKIDRSLVLTDRVFRNQINSLSGIVARVGVDYNQATKRFNYLVKQKRADGSPVIAQECCKYHMTSFAQFKLIMKAMSHSDLLVQHLPESRRVVRSLRKKT